MQIHSMFTPIINFCGKPQTINSGIKYSKNLTKDTFELNNKKPEQNNFETNAPKNINEVYSQLNLNKEQQAILEDVISEYSNGEKNYKLSPYELKSSLVSISQEYDESINDCFDLLGSDMAELVNDAINAKVYEKEIANHVLFSGYKLSLYDISKIHDYINNGDIGAISNLVKNKNPKLFEQLGGESFYIGNTKTESYINNLSVILANKEQNTIPKQSIGLINGMEKNLECENEIIPSENIKIKNDDIECLLKSNLITSDAIEIANQMGIDFSKINKSSAFLIPRPTTKDIKTDKNIKIDMNLDDIVQKIKDNGFEDLTTHEIHVITDWLSEEYKNNQQFKKNINSKLDQRAKDIMPYVDTVAKQLKQKLPDNLVIDNHFAMRMIDRDYIHAITESDHARENLLNALNTKDIEKLGINSQKEIAFKLEDETIIKAKVSKDKNNKIHLETII